MGIWRYAVILDAGSSGTRAHVYRWPDSVTARTIASSPKEWKSLPVLRTKDGWSKKTKPGVSTFAENPESVGPDHLRPLLDHALSVVPEDDVKETPIFLLATAGMRLLEPLQQNSILENVCSYIRTNTDFLLPDCAQHVQVIDGKTEGLYGWIAANYLLGGLDDPKSHDHGKGHHTYGFLDMGGASAQIAFAPNSTEAEKHANDLTLLRLRSLDGKPSEHRVFVTSWLGYGVREARHRYIDALLKDAESTRLKEIPDPCLQSGLRTHVDGTIVTEPPTSEHIAYLSGTGKFDECLHKTFPLLDKDAPCEDEPCLLHGMHTPAIDFDVNHFIGISEYWHTTHEIFEMGHKDKAYDFNTYQLRVKQFCSLDWADIAKGVEEHKWKKINQETAYEICFKASWLINILHDGIGIPRVGIEDTNENAHNGTKAVIEHGKEKGYLDAFQAVNKIDSTEVSWTLGKAVVYSASLVPPEPGSLPVGFGSNVPGVPADFQYPGPQLLPAASQPENNNSTLLSGSHWHDTLFDGDTPRRIPGVALFILIIFIALFFLCGQNRRKRIYRRLGLGRHHRGGVHYSKRRGGGAAGLFGTKLPIPFIRRTTPSYERVLEEGNPDFELGSVDSSDDDGHHHSPRSSGSDSGSHAAFKYGLGLNASSQSMHSNLDRSGLVVRTESREHLSTILGPTVNGRRSRATSPVRKSPLMTAVTDE